MMDVTATQGPILARVAAPAGLAARLLPMMHVAMLPLQLIQEKGNQLLIPYARTSPVSV